MCGIVGYVGNKSINSILLVGLIRLEYRGYDSAGIAVIDKGDLEIRKEKGKLKNLEELLKISPVEGSIGIGHTRWATHGEPSKKNAHPHVDCNQKIAVCHNGIIENHLTLRNELIQKGHLFRSETDTEVIPHLLEEELKNNPELTLKDIIPKALRRIEGKYAFVILSETEPDRIYFIKNGSPLLYAKNKEEGYLTSDIVAVIPQAKEYYVIKDKEWGWITQREIHLLNLESNSLTLTPELKEIKIDPIHLDKGNYEHYMLKEIHEQPDIFRKILENRLGEKGKIKLDEIKLPNSTFGRISRILITSAGTSWHAGLVGKLYLEHFARIVTEVDLSSEFRYRNPIAEGDTLVLAISQSGETADTLAGVLEAKTRFCKVVSFVNRLESTIARESDSFIDLMAGPEIGVASTKAYTSELIHLLFFALYLSGIKWLINKEDRENIFSEIRKLPTMMETILDKSEQIKEIAKKFKDKKDFIFLGRYFNHPTALEGALKLKEIAYVHASGYAGGEFKHGPIALIDENVPTICIAPKSSVYDKMLSNIQEVKSRKGKIIAIITEGDKQIPELADYYIEIPEVSEYLSPILTIIPLQLFAYYSAIERNCEPDQPRNLAKSVTVE
ncbi:MAG: glutamine--fructose-6-phosphate transaminase (isomerizing) [Leptonema sp. (in: bacteria)]